MPPVWVMVNEKEQKTVCGTVLVGGTVTNLSIIFQFLDFQASGILASTGCRAEPARWPPSMAVGTCVLVTMWHFQSLQPLGKILIKLLSPAKGDTPLSTCLCRYDSCRTAKCLIWTAISSEYQRQCLPCCIRVILLFCPPQANR